MFDLEKMSNYADDNFIIRSKSYLSEIINDMEKSLEAITKWLKKSIAVNGNIIQNKLIMNVLGVIFDSRLQWNYQVAHVISKSN